MSKLSAILAALSIFAAGAANATVSLATVAGPQVISTASDTTTTFKLPDTQSAGVLVDFTFSYTGTLQNNDFFGIWFGSSTGPSFGLKANCGGDTAGCTDDVFYRLSGVKGPYLAGSNLSANTSYRLAGYLYKSTGSSTYNNLDIWLNPTDSQLVGLTGASAHLTGASGLTSFSNIGFRTVNIDNGVVLTVNQINVSAVPEPGTLALMGLAAAGFGVLRRRKQA
jgi:hypothetical protein